MRQINESEYKEAFEIGVSQGSTKQDKALEHALDIRKFEIELYWKRATYFWTFIAAAIAGYAAIQAASIENKNDLSVYICCLGLVFSFAWYFVNRGSKQWQENWENHVDMLENNAAGPLYKIVLSRPKATTKKEWIREQITGPLPISVSKVNQIISLYVSIFWIFLLIKSMPPFDPNHGINLEYLLLISLTVIICICFPTLGRTYGGSYSHIANLREAKITPPQED